MLCKSVLLAVPFLNVALACSCLPMTQKDAFDQSDVVAHVTIVNEGTTWEEETKMYEIYYNETFKPILPKDPHIALETSPPKLISTPVESSMCGVEGLKVGAEYLISGLREHNTVSVMMCFGIPLVDGDIASGATQWSLIDERTLKQLSKGFT